MISATAQQQTRRPRPVGRPRRQAVNAQAMPSNNADPTPPVRWAGRPAAPRTWDLGISEGTDMSVGGTPGPQDGPETIRPTGNRRVPTAPARECWPGGSSPWASVPCPSQRAANRDGGPASARAKPVRGTLTIREPKQCSAGRRGTPSAEMAAGNAALLGSNRRRMSTVAPRRAPRASAPFRTSEAWGMANEVWMVAASNRARFRGGLAPPIRFEHPSELPPSASAVVPFDSQPLCIHSAPPRPSPFVRRVRVGSAPPPRMLRSTASKAGLLSFGATLGKRPGGDFTRCF